MQQLDGFSWQWLNKKIHPLFFPLVFFIIGLLVSSQIEQGNYLLIFLFSCILCSFAFLFVKDSRATLPIIFLFVFLGILRHQHYNKSQSFYTDSREGVHILELKKHLGETPKYDKFIAILEDKSKENSLFSSKTAILLYLKKKDSAAFVGQKVNAKGYFQQIKKTTNPYQFDYAQYMAKKKIFYQLFSSDYELQKASGLMFWLSKTRKKLLIFITSQYGKDAGVYAGSLILADKTVIGKEERALFSRAGIAHLFALSGLHVGIVFGFVLLISTFIFPFVKREYLQILSLVFIWLFALFAGMQASIVRACFMLSLFVFSRSILRPLSIFDTLTVSAFFLLLINPNWLWDVGFQLSYIAVFFIALSVQQFYFLIENKAKIQKYFIGLILVSITASIATAPLTLFYFHQLSWVGVAINLLLLPFFPLVMVVCFVTVLLSFFGFAPKIWVAFSDYFFDAISFVLNKGIAFQGSSFTEITLLIPQVFLLYVLFMLFYILAYSFRWKIFLLFASFFILFHAMGFYDNIKKSTKKEWVFFDDGKNPLILYRKGFYGKVFYSDSTKLVDSKKYILENYRINEKLKNLDFVLLQSNYNKVIPQKIVVDEQDVLSINPKENTDFTYTLNPKQNLITQKNGELWDVKTQGALTVKLNHK